MAFYPHFKVLNEKNDKVTDDFVYGLWKESLRAWTVLDFIRGYISLMAVSLLGARMPDFAFFPTYSSYSSRHPSVVVVVLGGVSLQISSHEVYSVFFY